MGTWSATGRGSTPADTSLSTLQRAWSVRVLDVLVIHRGSSVITLRMLSNFNRNVYSFELSLDKSTLECPTILYVCLQCTRGKVSISTASNSFTNVLTDELGTTPVVGPFFNLDKQCFFICTWQRRDTFSHVSKATALPRAAESRGCDNSPNPCVQTVSSACNHVSLAVIMLKAAYKRSIQVTRLFEFLHKLRTLQWKTENLALFWSLKVSKMKHICKKWALLIFCGLTRFSRDHLQTECVQTLSFPLSTSKCGPGMSTQISIFLLLAPHEPCGKIS